MIKKGKNFGWIVISVMLSFSNQNLAFAQSGNTGGGPGVIPNPLGTTSTLAGFVGLLLDTIFPIAAMFSVFYLIYAGFKMVVAGGNEEKLSESKRAFLWAVIGIGVLLGAKVISAVICGTINQLGSPTLRCQ